MPTDLPIQFKVQSQSNDWTKSGAALVMFYVIAGLAGLVLIGAENRLGMFGHLTVAESVVKASGVQFSIDGIDPMWASSPPL